MARGGWCMHCGCTGLTVRTWGAAALRPLRRYQVVVDVVVMPVRLPSLRQGKQEGVPYKNEQRGQ
jgi:ABC-type transport system involved in cytochrome c biogenesis permease component